MYTRNQKIEIYTISILSFVALELGLLFLLKNQFYAVYNKSFVPSWAIPLHMLFPMVTAAVILSGISGALIWMRRGSELRNVTLAIGAILLLFSPISTVTQFFAPYPILVPTVFTFQWILGIIFFTFAFMTSKLSAFCFLPYWIFLTYKLFIQWTSYILNFSY